MVSGHRASFPISRAAPCDSSPPSVTRQAGPRNGVLPLRLLPAGAIIEEDALIEAVSDGHLGGAFLDVAAVEPLPQESPLWGMRNVHAHHDLGFVSPAIYRIARNSGYHQAFHDITTGSNIVNVPYPGAGLGGYQVGPGWDPATGRVWVDGREVNRMTERERLPLRRDRVAFVFQAFGLVPMLSAAENIGIPLRIEGLRPSERRERVAAMLALTGLSSHAEHRPGELSGGQQQRVAIARVLAGRPGVLIADEPTSQLDLETGRQIMELLLSVVRRRRSPP